MRKGRLLSPGLYFGESRSRKGLLAHQQLPEGAHLCPRRALPSSSLAPTEDKELHSHQYINRGPISHSGVPPTPRGHPADLLRSKGLPHKPGRSDLPPSPLPGPPWSLRHAGPPPRPRGRCAPPTRSSPSVRCNPRRRSPTARSLTHRPPSRLTSRVWKRLQRRSLWSGPPQTAPPHGSTDAGDEEDEAAAAASGGGEATQRHKTLLTIGREAGAPGGEENAEDTRVSSDYERGFRDAGKRAGGAASGSPASLATPPARRRLVRGRDYPREGGTSPRTAHVVPDCLGQ